MCRAGDKTRQQLGEFLVAADQGQSDNLWSIQGCSQWQKLGVAAILPEILVKMEAPIEVPTQGAARCGSTRSLNRLSQS